MTTSLAFQAADAVAKDIQDQFERAHIPLNMEERENSFAISLVPVFKAIDPKIALADTLKFMFNKEAEPIIGVGSTPSMALKDMQNKLALLSEQGQKLINYQIDIAGVNYYTALTWHDGHLDLQTSSSLLTRKMPEFTAPRLPYFREID